MLNFKDCVEMSTKVKGESQAHEIDLVLMVDGVKCKAYEVSIANRDLLFYTDKGTVTYVIDSYGPNDHRAELFDYDFEE